MKDYTFSNSKSLRKCHLLVESSHLCRDPTPSWGLCLRPTLPLVPMHWPPWPGGRQSGLCFLDFSCMWSLSNSGHGRASAVTQRAKRPDWSSSCWDPTELASAICVMTCVCVLGVEAHETQGPLANSCAACLPPCKPPSFHLPDSGEGSQVTAKPAWLPPAANKP